MKTLDTFIIVQKTNNNLLYNRFKNCQEVVKEIENDKISLVISLTSQSIVVKALWQESS